MRSYTFIFLSDHLFYKYFSTVPLIKPIVVEEDAHGVEGAVLDGHVGRRQAIVVHTHCLKWDDVVLAEKKLSETSAPIGSWKLKFRPFRNYDKPIETTDRQTDRRLTLPISRLGENSQRKTSLILKQQKKMILFKNLRSRNGYTQRLKKVNNLSSNVEEKPWGCGGDRTPGGQVQ